MSSASGETNLASKNLTVKLIFRINPNLHTVSITHMFKKVITVLDFSKVSGLDFIPVVILKICELEFSDLLADLFRMCFQESCFPAY